MTGPVRRAAYVRYTWESLAATAALMTAALMTAALMTATLMTATLHAQVASPARISPLDSESRNVFRPLPARVADTLFLDDLQRAAESADRRTSQLEILAQQSALRLRSIRSERRPSLSATGTAQYLSDVTSVGAMLPGGAGIPAPYNEQFDSYLSVRQSLIDPTRPSRARVEHAQRAELQSRVETTLWQVRSLVNDAFFGIVLRDAQRAAIDATITDLLARRATAEARVSAGAALASDVLLVDAEIARRRQARSELIAEREALRSVLASLTGQTLGDHSTAPAVVFAVRSTDATLPPPVNPDVVRTRPEFTQFAKSRALLDARRDATSATDRPRLSAFGRTGYGRPGLNQLGRGFDAYWTAGIQLEWAPWTWGRTDREREVQLLQLKSVDADERALADALHRTALIEYARIQALTASLDDDASIIALRERVLNETRLRHDAGDVTSADYVARSTELLSAQLERDTRRVRLSEARARYLTTLGREIR